MPNLVYINIIKAGSDGKTLGGYTCTGTLINAGLYPELFPRVTSEFFVITAAHCLVNDDAPYQISSKVNVFWSPDTKVIANMKQIEAGRIIIHPEYNTYVVTKNQTGDIVGYNVTLYNDIEIVEVSIKGEDDLVKKLIKVDFTKDISDFPEDGSYIQAGYGLVLDTTPPTPLPDRGYWLTNAHVNSHATTIQKYGTNFQDVKTIFVDRLIVNNRFKIVETVDDILYAAGGDSGGALWASDKKSIVGIASTSVYNTRTRTGYATYVTTSLFLQFIKTAVDQIIPLKSYSTAYSEDCNSTISVRDFPEYI